MTKATQRANRARGAYGMALTGMPPPAEALLVPAESSWPKFDVVVETSKTAPALERVGPAFADLLPSSGGAILIDRSAGRIEILTVAPAVPEALVHPTLAHPASIVAWWYGRESFHAGTVVVAGGAWALIAARGGGKSSTLAELVARDFPLVADDLLVVDDGRAFLGPRSLDLRRDAAERVQGAVEMGVVGARERWRLVVGPAPPRAPLRWWFALEWGPTLDARLVPPRERIALIGAQRAVNLPPRDPTTLIALTALPVWLLQRPRDPASLPAVATLIEELASS